MYRRHDEKGLNWEPGGVRSGAGVCSSGVSQDSSGSSETREAAFCRLTLHLPQHWPWETQFSRAMARLQAIQLPA